MSAHVLLNLLSLGKEIKCRAIYLFFATRKNIILCILKGISPFKMHKIIFFSRRPEKEPRFHQ